MTRKQSKKQQTKKVMGETRLLQSTIPSGKWKGTVLIAILFVAALAFVYTISKGNTTLTGNAISDKYKLSEKYKTTKASNSFLATLSALDDMDLSFHTSITDYTKGLHYIYANPRYPNPFNSPEIARYISDLEYVPAKTPSSVQMVEFRKNLAASEMHFKLSKKDYRGDLTLGTKCKYKPFVDASLDEQNQSIVAGRKALDILRVLQTTYAQDYAAVDGITPEWMKNMKNSLIDLEGEMTYKRQTFYGIWNQHCINVGSNTSFT